ncbi:MAG: DUF5819 family protein [bacterium]
MGAWRSSGLHSALAIWTTAVTAAVAAAAYAGYVLITVLYLAPPNPVTALHLRSINTIMYPLFAQNWHLFAPSPIRMNFVLTARCRVGDEVTEWRDITTPLLARHHEDRNSPMSRLLRTQSTAVHQVLGRTGDEWLPLVCRRDQTLPACRGEDESSRRTRERALFLINRVASAGCDRLVGIGRANAVQGRILVHNPPPWSQRHLPSDGGRTRYIPLPWGEYQAWRKQ